MKRRISIMVVIICVLSFCALPAKATLITIEIEAIVDSVDDEGNYLEGQINVGDIITGFYNYESTTSDSNPSANVGDYEHSSSPYGIFLSVGGFDFQTDLTNVDFLVELVNNNAGIDGYLVISYNNLSLSNGTLVDTISWQLDDDSEAAISSDVLPTTGPVLTNWPGNHLRLHGERGGYIIDATVTSAIPEPATFFLLISGGFILRIRAHFLK